MLCLYMYIIVIYKSIKIFEWMKFVFLCSSSLVSIVGRRKYEKYDDNYLYVMGFGYGIRLVLEVFILNIWS